MRFSLSDFLESGAIISLSQDKILVGWGEFQRLKKDKIDPAKPAFYFNDFFLTAPDPWLQYNHWMEIEKGELANSLKSAISFDPCLWKIQQPEKFKIAFEELQQLLQSGVLQKGVPYLFIHSSEKMDSLRLQFSLANGLDALEGKKGYLYGHWDSSHGVLGITPELLFSSTRSEPSKVSTMALAGTCSSTDCKTTFFKDPKQRFEHQIVVQGIKQALECLGNVKISEIQLLELPRLIHLMTPIEVDLTHSFDFETIVSTLHPTPALGAFPKVEGKRWLQNFHKHSSRQYYGAPIGFLFPQRWDAHCFAAIRNVQWGASGMRIGAGCGVVKQSCLENEWEEIQLKVKSIREQFRL